MYELTGAVGAQEDSFIKRLANGTRSALSERETPLQPSDYRYAGLCQPHALGGRDLDPDNLGRDGGLAANFTY